MVKRWIVFWSILSLVALVGQASAIQVDPGLSPSKPKKTDKITFNVTVTNNETDAITAVEVWISFSFKESESTGLTPDQPNPNDDSVSADVAPAGKTTFHATFNLALETSTKLGKSFTYNFTINYWHKVNGTEVNRSSTKTVDYTVTFATAAAAKKNPGFEMLVLVPAVVIAAMLVRRRVR